MGPNNRHEVEFQSWLGSCWQGSRKGRSLSACVPAGRALCVFFFVFFYLCALAKTRSDPTMKCLMSNEFWITAVLNCRMNSLHIYLKDRRNWKRFIHIPFFFFFFSTGEHFEMKSGPVGGGHAVFDYDDSQKNVMTNWTSSLSENESEEEWEGRQGGMEKEKAFFFFFLLPLLFDRTVRLWQWRRGKWGSK